jgi:predicted DCC family thiol-disulfide oxidoreductase YuxK
MTPAGREGTDLLLYDGVCGLCSGLTRFVLRMDRDRRFHFASLQSAAARAVLKPFDREAGGLTTFYILVGYRGPRPVLLARGRAALFVMSTLGWPWKAIGVAGILPDSLLDRGYDLISRHRYRLFGRLDACPIPPPEHRARFLDS